ncbi:MAG: DNA primase [Bacilli bacterium]|nr:DNA primase [Bacilli bacterium]
MNNQNTINDIRSKLNIVDIVSEYVPLTKKGQYYWGICPFHNDKNPSMSVDEKRQTYTCWSCHNSGNVFNFVEQIENISFKDALKKLGSRVGIAVEGSSSYNNKYNKYYEIYDLASKYYQLMINTDKGLKAKEYLNNREINNDTIKEFGIGLSLDDKDKLVTYLKEKKYDINTLNDLGLANNDIDTFINRIIFPLDDRNGRIVGFSGRIYDNSKMSKYMNTKETPIFRKGTCLYHYNASKEFVRSEKYVLVMEGFMDVIRASTIGIKNTVALMGTALTEEQISLLKKLSLNVYLCLDGDKPGQDADLHNGELLEKAGLNVKVVCLTSDEDPDSFILKYGEKKFKSLVENASNFSDFKIDNLKKDVNFESDIELSRYVNQVIKEVSEINDEIRCEIILKKLANETNLSYNTLEKKLNEYKSLDNEKRKSVDNNVIGRKDAKKDKYKRASEEFIYYMLINPKAIKVYDSKNLYFIDSDLRALAAEISYYYNEYGKINIADFYSYLNDKKELLNIYNVVQNLNLDENISDVTIMEYVSVIEDYNIKQEIKRLEEVMRKEKDEDTKVEILERIRKLRIGEIEK